MPSWTGEFDILVCTSIIENGLDVPNANTLIVDGADRFGLAQLYQIRGRVGRSDRRAYCYLVIPEAVTEEAEKRLRVLEHYTDLGSGYSVALRDLELRGAGNLLGADQSGFAHAVGLDTYLRLLEKTVERLKKGGEEARYPGTGYDPLRFRFSPGHLHFGFRPEAPPLPAALEDARARGRWRSSEGSWWIGSARSPGERQALLDGAVLRLLGQGSGSGTDHLEGAGKDG